ncbi:MAG TPA: ATP-binding protein [Acidobacteriota bacterium]|nr:ATP-binding protein [Acidobacteriota bacterium]
MMHSLRWRLFLMTVAISVVAVLAVGLASSQITSIELNKVVTGTEPLNLEPYRVQLLEHYQKHQSWDQITPLLRQIAQVTERDGLLVDAENQVIAASVPELTQARITFPEPDKLVVQMIEELPGAVRREVIANEQILIRPPRTVLIDATGKRLGMFFLLPRPEAEPIPPRTRVAAVNRSLFWAVSGIGLLALVATAIVSRRIVGPVEALTAAVHRMEQGDLAQRVTIHSSDEIGQLATAFNRMADSVARSEQLRRTLVNDVAHELRTPLTNIRCQLEAVQDGLLAADTEVVASLHEEVLLLSQLVNDLQDLALAEANQIKLTLAEVELQILIEQALVSLSPQATARRITISSDVPPDLPAVWADARRVSQILRNLLVNALQHTPAGGTICIQVFKSGNQVELQVTDSGEGIESEHLPFIFDRFYRADPARARAQGGAGLGLAIVKQLVQMHTGHITVTSQKNIGTTFRVTLPITSTPS